VAALGSFLDARSHGGTWQVRMDDLDPPRVARGAADSILRCLERFGLSWDGAVVWQGRRAAAYHAAIHALRQRDLLYPCVCSRKDASEGARTAGDHPIYPGNCRNGLSTRQIARAIRIRVNDDPVTFHDPVQGTVAQDLLREVGDFVLYKSDGIYAYHLACAVDDAEQGITHVVRGADLMDSTPRQIYLQRQLGLPTPRYLHLPVALNAQGEKLSKQTLAEDISERPVIPALLDALIFLGQTVEHHGDFATVQDLLEEAVRQWDSSRVPRRRTTAATG
jgi:glutamyl-Q tRNA(Asp) synthetase